MKLYIIELIETIIWLKFKIWMKNKLLWVMLIFKVKTKVKGFTWATHKQDLICEGIFF